MSIFPETSGIIFVALKVFEIYSVIYVHVTRLKINRSGYFSFIFVFLPSYVQLPTQNCTRLVSFVGSAAEGRKLGWPEVPLWMPLRGA
jgi:hypothetical protein